MTYFEIIMYALLLALIYISHTEYLITKDKFHKHVEEMDRKLDHLWNMVYSLSDSRINKNE